MKVNKKFIAIHCADTYASMDIDVEDVRRWHLKRGWTDIGYAYFVKRDGTPQKGRDLNHDGNAWDDTGAHVRGYNEESIGICYAGGMGPNGEPQFNATEEQMATLKFLVDELETLFPDIVTQGHCDFPDVTKACPVFDVKAWRRTW